MISLFDSKKTIADSGILAGLTDRHSHLLPGVDDGIRTMDDSLAALAFMEEAGISRVWLTPHIMEDMPNRPEDLQSRFEELQQNYKGGIQLRLAAEHMLDNLFLERFEAGKVMPMENGMLLIETSYFNPPMELDGIIGDIINKGYRPLLAHPERYKYMDDSDYRRLKDKGILFQLNLGAIAGGYSKETHQKAQRLLKQGYYDYLGSDTHSLRSFQSIISKKILSKSEGKRLLELAERE